MQLIMTEDQANANDEPARLPQRLVDLRQGLVRLREAQPGASDEFESLVTRLGDLGNQVKPDREAIWSTMLAEIKPRPETGRTQPEDS